MMPSEVREHANCGVGVRIQFFGPLVCYPFIIRSRYSTIYLILRYLLSDYNMPYTVQATLHDCTILALHQLYEIATVQFCRGGT